MKIAFMENHLNIRGTTLEVFYYAYYNKKILGNESIIVTRPYEMFKHSVDVDKSIYDKFEKEFPVYYYRTHADIVRILDEQNVDAVYVQKSGDSGDGLHSFGKHKTFVHAVFAPQHPHGEFYAGISEWLNIQFKTNIPVLPYIITLPETYEDGRPIVEDFREKLNIPKDAIVFGRHGGFDTFDIPQAQRAVERVSRENPNIYFLMMHTKPFCSSRPNVIHLPKCSDAIEKVKFINTCDAMVYGRSEGESFGVAIGEFSIKNKPIFGTYTYPRMGSLMHRYILQDRAYWYNSEEELVTQMLSFTPEERNRVKNEDWNMYKQYSPENVMKIFESMINKMLNK